MNRPLWLYGFWDRSLDDRAYLARNGTWYRGGVVFLGAIYVVASSWLFKWSGNWIDPDALWNDLLGVLLTGLLGLALFRLIGQPLLDWYRDRFGECASLLPSERDRELTALWTLLFSIGFIAMLLVLQERKSDSIAVPFLGGMVFVVAAGSGVRLNWVVAFLAFVALAAWDRVVPLGELPLTALGLAVIAAACALDHYALVRLAPATPLAPAQTP